MPKSNELKLERCTPTEAVAECRKEDKKGGRVHAGDGIQSRSEKPRFLRPTGFSGGTTYGTHHPKVAIRVNNRGAVLRAKGDLDGA